MGGGARTGRNQNFDVFQERLNTIRHKSGAKVNRVVNAALAVQLFNTWNASHRASAIRAGRSGEGVACRRASPAAGWGSRRAGAIC